MCIFLYIYMILGGGGGLGVGVVGSSGACRNRAFHVDVDMALETYPNSWKLPVGFFGSGAVQNVQYRIPLYECPQFLGLGLAMWV